MVTRILPAFSEDCTRICAYPLKEDIWKSHGEELSGRSLFLKAGSPFPAPSILAGPSTWMLNGMEAVGTTLPFLALTEMFTTATSAPSALMVERSACAVSTDASPVVAMLLVSIRFPLLKPMAFISPGL